MSGIPDDFLPSSGMTTVRRKSIKKKWNNTPTEDSGKRVDEWVGGSPTGHKQRRSWKVKEISPLPKEYIKEILEAPTRLQED